MPRTALISIQNNKGFPRLNGPTEIQNLVYPSSGIDSLPSIYLGSAGGVRGMFVFASGAIPAQDNYNIAKSTDQIGVSDAMEYINDPSNYDDDEQRQVFEARKRNAEAAVPIFLNDIINIYGETDSALNHVQIICYSTSLEEEQYTWASKIMNSTNWTNERWRKLLIPFLMADFIDVLPDGVEVSGANAPNNNMAYNAICIMTPAADNLEGHFTVFGSLLFGMFISANGCSWNVKSNSHALEQRYNAILNGFTSARRYTDSLVWFTEILQTYLARNRRGWTDVWPNHLSRSGSPISFISEDMWEQLKRSNAPLIHSLVSHARANLSVNRRFKDLMSDLADAVLSLSVSTVRGGPRGGAVNFVPGSPNEAFGPKSGLIAELSSLKPQLAVAAVRVGFSVWQERTKAFRNNQKLFDWIKNVANSPLNMRKPSLYSVATWPLWRVIMTYSPYGHMRQFSNKEIKARADHLLLFLETSPYKVMQSKKACAALVSYRDWWLKAKFEKHVPDRSISILDSILNELRV
jgi:hypothetical protein